MGDQKTIKRPVIKAFKCKLTGNHYAVGNVYKHDDEERIAALIEGGFLSPFSADAEETENDSNQKDSEFPKHVGGGTFELSDGTKVKGKEAAIEAQKLIEEQGDLNAAGGQKSPPDQPE